MIRSTLRLLVRSGFTPEQAHHLIYDPLPDPMERPQGQLNHWLLRGNTNRWGSR